MISSHHRGTIDLNGKDVIVNGYSSKTEDLEAEIVESEDIDITYSDSINLNLNGNKNVCIITLLAPVDSSQFFRNNSPISKIENVRCTL